MTTYDANVLATKSQVERVAVSALDNPYHDGDWHDKPLRYSVTGPGVEVQNFSTKKDATKYASLRRRAATQQEATRAFIRWA